MCVTGFLGADTWVPWGLAELFESEVAEVMTLTPSLSALPQSKGPLTEHGAVIRTLRRSTCRAVPWQAAAFPEAV